MEELLKRLGIDETADAEEIVGKLKLKQSEIMERLDNVEDEKRKQELKEDLKKIEAAITAFSWMGEKEQTGIAREEDVTPDDFTDLKGQSIIDDYTVEDLANLKGEIMEDEKQVEMLYDKALALLKTPDYERGIALMWNLAENGCGYGYTPAICQMAEIGWSHANEVSDKYMNRKWHELAADLGYAPAQTARGTLFSYNKNYQEAMEWYQKAIAQGDAPAYREMGELYYYGRGVKQDYAKAREWYIKAAEMGDVEAQRTLGESSNYKGMHANLYLGDQGFEFNVDKAARWFQMAAEQGDVHSQFELGCIYEKGGVMVRSDYDKAVEWFKKAAKQGYGPAKDHLAIMGTKEQYEAKKAAERAAYQQRNEAEKKEKRKKNIIKLILAGVVIIIVIIILRALL